AAEQDDFAGVVALRHDAGELRPAHHEECADMVVGHHPDCLEHRILGLDGKESPTLAIEQVTHGGHVHLRTSLWAQTGLRPSERARRLTLPTPRAQGGLLGPSWGLAPSGPSLRAVQNRSGDFVSPAHPLAFAEPA